MRGKAGMLITRVGEWDISFARYINDFSVVAQDFSGLGNFVGDRNNASVFFSPDGLSMYTTATLIQRADINQWSLGSAWDITTASLAYDYTQAFSVSFYDQYPGGLFFSPDGLSMYFIGQLSNAVFQYSLSTAWDIATASYVQSFSVSAQHNGPSGLFFRQDGLRMYVSGYAALVSGYSLASAWDISTASHVQTIDVSDQESTPADIWLRPDGLRAYIAGASEKAVLEYSLSTAWDLSTASYQKRASTDGQFAFPSGLFFRNDGLRFFVFDRSGNEIQHFAMGYH